MKILLAEDDANIVTIAKMSLETLGGHQVQVVNDGAAAVEALKAGTFDVVILDEMMPKMGGRQVYDIYVRHMDGQTPIIFMSANIRSDAEPDLPPPCVGFIAKPFEPMNLPKQVEDILSRATQNRKAV